jgi:predicted  nucleic acid-binding Zn-ribbon protein
MRMKLVAPIVQISWGELIDKITILEIKSDRLKAPSALENVRLELEMLMEAASPQLAAFLQLGALKDSLAAVNAELWDIEDRLREKEAVKTFDDEFTKLARAVYITNDKRAAVKRQINMILGSTLVEEKSYAPYSAPPSI